MKVIRLKTWYVLLSLLLLQTSFQSYAQKTGKLPAGGIEVADVVSAFRVGFSMIEKQNKLYMAYYDKDHQMVLATYNKANGKLDYNPLPSKVPWDSHNYITMTFDDEGYLHLSGNMHAGPLVYFRSSRPFDIHSMKAIHHMTGKEETRTTYPHFMRDTKGELIFHYRVGGSGNGYEVYNVYNQKSKTWSRLLDKPLIDGFGQRNAYMNGPVKSSDGYFHLAWVWRDSPDCSTNHTLSYARSKDLIHWESVRGEKTSLPLSIDKKEFYLDPVPVKGGLFNPTVKLGFDSNGAPLIAYMKYDKNGYNQFYLSRFVKGKWEIHQLTNWNYRWLFEGNGTINSEITMGSPYKIGNNEMGITFTHIKEGKGVLVFNENTLKLLRVQPLDDSRLADYKVVTSSYPGMSSHILTCGDYLLRWETLPSNRDRKPETIPAPSKLVLYKYK